MSHPMGTVGVIGGGQMGAGIAQVFATAGARVVVVDVDLAAARERVSAGLAESDRRGKLAIAPSVILDRVHFAREVEANTGLVIEAVPEKTALKIEVLTMVERQVSAEAVLASNTSALSIAELGATLAKPQRFIGMHFFNPVPASRLVEIVPSSSTSELTLDRVLGWVRALDKQAIVVTDTPGFATSRLGVALGLEAIRMLEDGVARAEDIDLAMELGYRHPMGPLRLTDIVGLDVRLDIAEYLYLKLGERFSPPQLLRDKVKRGELGRKTGQGFYFWGRE